LSSLGEYEFFSILLVKSALREIVFSRFAAPSPLHSMSRRPSPIVGLSWANSRNP
jgi:hypothetical protein